MDQDHPCCIHAEAFQPFAPRYLMGAGTCHCGGYHGWDTPCGRGFTRREVGDGTAFCRCRHWMGGTMPEPPSFQHLDYHGTDSIEAI